MSGWPPRAGRETTGGLRQRRLASEGRMPPIVITPHMARWDRWGRQVLRDGDIVFRRGDARLAHGFFPMSRFLANCSNSPFSHTGIVSIEQDGPVVYDTTRTGVARQPFCVWVLDNVGWIGVKRLRPGHKDAIKKVIAYCHKVFDQQIPFDYELSDDDKALYCVEMTEKAFRSAGIKLSDPIRLGDMERASEFPICMFGLQFASRLNLEHPLTFDSLVYFPGNERHGIWSAKQLMTVVPPTFAPGYPDMSEGVPVVGIPPASAAGRPKKVSAPGEPRPRPRSRARPVTPRSRRKSHPSPRDLSNVAGEYTRACRPLSGQRPSRCEGEPESALGLPQGPLTGRCIGGGFRATAWLARFKYVGFSTDVWARASASRRTGSLGTASVLSRSSTSVLNMPCT